jgi:hypothetical protein
LPRSLRGRIGPGMNWRRLLFRLWLIASGIWMCAWTLHIWQSCTTDLGEVWCRTDYNEWYSAFSKFTPLTYAVIAVWGMVPPLAILAWGGVVYWALTGFRIRSMWPLW